MMKCEFIYYTILCLMYMYVVEWMYADLVQVVILLLVKYWYLGDGFQLKLSDFSPYDRVSS